MGLYAWTNRETPEELVELAGRFPGLGLVLKVYAYTAVRDLAVPPIAYVTGTRQAEMVRDLALEGHKWLAVIVNDEQNSREKNSHSGPYVEPEVYAERFMPIYEILHGIVPVHTMGLMSVATNWWDNFLWTRKFDQAYHDHLPPADGRAFNPNKVRKGELNRALSRNQGPWILSPASFRGRWDRFMEPVSVAGWGNIAQRDNVMAVAIWCIKEVQEDNGRWQAEHGLLDRNNNLTNVGREVLRALRGKDS
jgi:hypothetical protein